jgi:hypothetical protein
MIDTGVWRSIGERLFAVQAHLDGEETFLLRRAAYAIRQEHVRRKPASRFHLCRSRVPGRP